MTGGSKLSVLTWELYQANFQVVSVRAGFNAQIRRCEGGDGEGGQR